jgi:arylsulfatase
VRHVVLITVDTLRADRIGAYGYSAATTPALDALAAESIRFERAYAHSSATLPSVSSLMTGKLPGEHGLFSNLGQLTPDLPTLATLLQDAGFESAAFIGSYALRPSRGLAQGFGSYTNEYRSAEAVRDEPENLAGPLTDEAEAWLEQRDPTKRLFLWVHYQEPHGPYTPPRFEMPAIADSDPVLPLNPTNSGVGGIPKYQWLGHGRLAEYQARYDGEISEFDRHLGRLLEVLERTGVLADSVLVFSSDHGEAFGEGGVFCAHSEGLSDAMLQVPLLMRVPGHPAAVRTDRVRQIDVLPTLLELLGVTAGDLPGESLLVDRGDRDVVSQLGRHWKKRWRSMRSGEFELREQGRGEISLLAPPGTSVPADLRERLRAALEDQAPWRASKDRGRTRLTPEERDALKALGYLD